MGRNSMLAKVTEVAAQPLQTLDLFHVSSEVENP